MTTVLDLDLLLDELAGQIRGWSSALDEAGMRRVEQRARPPGWLARLEASGAAAGADPSEAGLVPITHFGVASFGLDAEVRLAGPAGSPAPPIRFVLAQPGAGSPPDAVMLRIRLDAAADGTVRLGPWQAVVGAGRRIGAWQRPATADGAVPSSAAPAGDSSQAGGPR